MYKLNVETHIGLKNSLLLSAELAQFLLSKGFATSMTPRKKVLEAFIGLEITPELSKVYVFLEDILKDSNSEFFTIQIEAIPAEPKLNPIFNSIEILPEEDRLLVLVFTDQEIMAGVKYCKNHDEFHTRKGDVKKHLIHQWAYADDFYAQLNLPEFPKLEPNPNLFEEAFPALLKLLILDAIKTKMSEQKNSKPFH